MVELFQDIGILFPNILFQLVTFLVFVYLMYRVFYRPMQRTLHERRERIRASLEEAAHLRAQAEAEREQSEVHVRLQREDAHREREEVHRRVRIIEEEEVKAARADAERIRHEAQLEAARVKARALEEAREEIADLVIEATGMVLQRSIDDPEHRRLVERALAELGGRSV